MAGPRPAPRLTDRGAGGAEWPMRLVGLLFFLLVFPSALWAACPNAPDTTDEQAAILAEVRAAESEAEAMALTEELWRIWTRAPDQIAQEHLNAGVNRREAYDFDGAKAHFDALIEYCPDYAEGYNQRAFVAFLRQDYAAAVEDLDKALERAPLHVAAMAGKALSLMALGRRRAARGVLEQALELHPWLPERTMLSAFPGTDL